MSARNWLATALLAAGIVWSVSAPIEGAPAVTATRAQLPTNPPASTPRDPGEEAYNRHCTACHGATGRGDGPAGRMFDPGPPDFMDPEGLRTMTDEEVLGVLTSGRRAMPAFEAILELELRRVIVAYLRRLSEGVS